MIRLLLALIIIFFTLLPSLKANNSIKKNEFIALRCGDTTSFRYHYAVLDSIAKKNQYDTSNSCIRSVRFMENLTGIKAHPDGDYFGWFYFTRKDLVAWKNWHEKNKFIKSNASTL